VLIAEENFHQHFRGDVEKTGEARNYKRYGLPGKRWAWAEHHDRFNLDKEPNEANRFGWIVEIDPYDAASTPVKRTALGRFKHECATTMINPDGRVTVYSGDDQRFDYLYKFVTAGRFDPNDRAANRDLLDTGTLYVAKFEADGTMTWLPVTFGTGPLTAENGFNSHADVMIETRRAADLLEATPMDRPEDVETNPVNGRTYVMCTNNSKRKPEQVNAANTRAKSKHGHVIELIPPMTDGKADHTALEYRWEFFLLAGDPANPDDRAMYLADISANGWLSSPDNCTFDAKGRIWISTDGQPKSGISDSVYAADTYGPGRGLTRCFFNAPTGAEICGPTFTPDYRTLFLAIQHPADDKDSTFDNPSTRWPDFADNMPPRPSVVAIVKDDGGEIGS
jgi:secreted PhoX family phosphatase